MSGEDGGKDGGTGWMYNQNAGADKEDYLLGKRIGDNYETEGTMGQINAVEYDCAPPSIFASRAEHQVDLQRKLLEDPLVAIKKREVEDRKKILDNPLKMKALQEHIETLKNAKKNKKKKKKKKKHRGSDSDDSDTDLDLKLLQRLQKMEGREQEEDRKRFAHEAAEKEKLEAVPKYTDKEEEPDTPPRDNRNRNARFNNRSKTDRSERRNYDFSERRNYDRSERRNNDFSERRDRDIGRSKRSASRERPRRSRSRSPAVRRRSRSNDRRRRQRSDSRNGGGRSPSPDRRRHSPSREQQRRRSPSRDQQRRRPRHDSSDENTPPRKEQKQQRRRSPSPTKQKRSAKSPEVKKEKLEEDEKARRLAEMMSNASWREEQRANKVNKYREKDAAEQEQIKKEHDPEFLQRELRRAAAASSVETRIKSNKHNIQRGVGVMDSNFAKR